MRYILFFLLPLKLICSPADDILSGMSLDEKIGQLFMLPAAPKRDEKSKKLFIDIIKKYHIGGIIVKQSDPFSQINFLNVIQKNVNIPLLVSSDSEWGLGMRMENTISYPKNYYLSKVKDENLLYQLGQEIARELKLVGVHINLAPVVDISSPDTVCIKERSFSINPKVVARKAIKIAKGMQDENILACAKHFPGLGEIKVDPHLDLPYADHDLARLKNIEFVPYYDLINNDIAMIMSSHIVLKKISSLPATLSHEIITDILRNELNFKGLIITDALNMKALMNNFSAGEIALLAHRAGNDILLYGDDIYENIDDILFDQLPKAFRAIKEAYLNNQIDMSFLDSAVLKVLKAKEKLKILVPQKELTFIEEELNSKYARDLKKRLEDEISKN